MSVIPITIFFSLLLVGIFVWLFAREQRHQRFASTERDSLLPLADETPRLASPPSLDAPGHESEEDHHHDHAPHEHHEGKGPCGCRTGTRSPCSGCRRHLRPEPLTSV